MSGILTAPRTALLDNLERQPADPLLAVIGMHRADKRQEKIDLGVGVYRNDHGATPVMRAVKLAEHVLLEQQASKSYLGAEGDQRFTDLIAEIALGPTLASSLCITGVQTPGGTGALRLAAETLARTGQAPRIWVTAPTWPNHAPIFRAAGLEVLEAPYYDPVRSGIDFCAFANALTTAAPGDVLLLHGCCHNPTGTAFSPAEWHELCHLALRRGLVPLVDLAYQGLGHGLDEDASGMRSMLASVPEMIIAYSCDKNFGLYRERVGALWIKASSAKRAIAVRDTLLLLARSLWSMPPDHGAAVVRTILDDPMLTSSWRQELRAMATRLNTIRQCLAEAHPALASLGKGQGLFALLPIDAQQVARLREEQGIYMPDSGRMNVAGLTEASAERFVAALAPYLPGKHRTA